jgi:alginate O-acetyltransferase complex protein AlgI
MSSARLPKCRREPDRTAVFKIALYGLVFLFSLVVTAKVASARLRTIVLLAASCVLYLAWSSLYFGVLLFSTAANFGFGIWIRKNQSRIALLAGVLANLALLATFKYLPSVAVTLPFASLQKFSQLALPLGISFWTFQALSYLFDVYRDEDLDPSFAEFALYMAFFPVVVSGPICRMPDMLPQFRSTHTTKWDDIVAGLRRIATGVLMMLLARVLGQGILAGDGIASGFDHLKHWGGADVWCLAFGYGLQLFFDFAGYSHIAIGAAKALGLTVPENFARPFSSTTPSVFWTRWHMSLSFWIRDFVFIPLAVMRREMWWRNAMLVVAMVAFGVWHKATILFVLWGCYHGALLLLHRLIQQAQRKFDWNPPEPLWTAVSWLITISLVSLGWIFFRANSLLQAREMFAAVISPVSYSSQHLSGSLYGLALALAVGYILVLLTTEILDRHTTDESTSSALAALARNRWYWVAPLYAVTLLFILMITLTQSGGTAQFMYSGF